MQRDTTTGSRFLGAAVIGLAAFLGGRTVLDAWPRSAEDAPECEEGTCVQLGLEAEVPAGEDLLRRDEVCVSVGYLCSDPAEPDSFRVLRWPEPSRVLVVHIPSPEESSDRAAELRRAAIRGILRWDGTPLRIRILERPAVNDPADFSIRWETQLDDRRLGLTRYEWRRRGNTTQFQVVDLALVTRDPFNLGRILSAEEVELAAAHEMGHALGLGHSDAPEDVMFPENTAVRLTARDYSTVAALYRLPNGALVR